MQIRLPESGAKTAGRRLIHGGGPKPLCRRTAGSGRSECRADLLKTHIVIRREYVKAFFSRLAALRHGVAAMTAQHRT